MGQYVTRQAPDNRASSFPTGRPISEIPSNNPSFRCPHWACRPLPTPGSLLWRSKPGSPLFLLAALHWKPVPGLECVSTLSFWHLNPNFIHYPRAPHSRGSPPDAPCSPRSISWRTEPGSPLSRLADLHWGSNLGLAGLSSDSPPWEFHPNFRLRTQPAYFGGVRRVPPSSGILSRGYFSTDFPDLH